MIKTKRKPVNVYTKISQYMTLKDFAKALTKKGWKVSPQFLNFWKNKGRLKGDWGSAAFEILKGRSDENGKLFDWDVNQLCPKTHRKCTMRKPK